MKVRELLKISNDNVVTWIGVAGGLRAVTDADAERTIVQISTASICSWHGLPSHVVGTTAILVKLS